jgi:hypothetical protein
MLADELVFSIDGDGYRWRDVVVAAWTWGDWDAVERRAREGNACVRHAQAVGAGLPPGTLEAAGQEFRYARELVTAHSMEEWLRSVGLTAREWTAHLRRELHRAHHSSPPTFDELVARYPTDDRDAVSMVLADATCAGDADRWARSLAARVAANRTAAASGDRASLRTTGDHLGVVPTALATALGVDDHGWRAAVRRIADVDRMFERFRMAQVTDHAVETFVASRQLDWIRFECRVMAFPKEDMAAEAAMMLRDDGEGFTGVYRVARAEPRASHFFFDNLDSTVRDRFLGVQAGDLVGPIQVGDEFVLYLVERKVLPSARDPEIRRLAEDGVLGRALKQQLDHHVEWHAVLY